MHDPRLTAAFVQFAIAALEEWERVGAKDSIYGICENLNKLFMDCSDLDHYQASLLVDAVIDHSVKWEKFSGHIIYPVPGAWPLSEHHHRADAIHAYMDTLSSIVLYPGHSGMWSGDYGMLRRELCGFLAQELRKL